MLTERACVYNMLINLMETREAGKRQTDTSEIETERNRKFLHIRVCTFRVKTVDSPYMTLRSARVNVDMSLAPPQS